MKRIAITLILFQLIGCAKQPAIVTGQSIKEKAKPTQEETKTPEPTQPTISETLTGYWNSIKGRWNSLSITQILLCTGTIGLVVGISIVKCQFKNFLNDLKIDFNDFELGNPPLSDRTQIEQGNPLGNPLRSEDEQISQGNDGDNLNEGIEENEQAEEGVEIITFKAGVEETFKLDKTKYNGIIRKGLSKERIQDTLVNYVRIMESRKTFIEQNLNELERDINQLKQEMQEMIESAENESASSLLTSSISLQFLEFMNNYYRRTGKRAKVILKALTEEEFSEILGE